MAGRQSSAVENALFAYRLAKRRSPFPDIYKIAAQHKVAPSSLYRAIRNGKK
jgi:hypothetical protein